MTDGGTAEGRKGCLGQTRELVKRCDEDKVVGVRDCGRRGRR